MKFLNYRGCTTINISYFSKKRYEKSPNSTNFIYT